MPAFTKLQDCHIFNANNSWIILFRHNESGVASRDTINGSYSRLWRFDKECTAQSLKQVKTAKREQLDETGGTPGVSHWGSSLIARCFFTFRSCKTYRVLFGIVYLWKSKHGYFYFISFRRQSIKSFYSEWSGLTVVSTRIVSRIYC